MTIYGVDCDMRRVHCISEHGVVVCKNHPNVGPICEAAKPGDTILFEVASALDYTDSKAIAHQKHRWMIWNTSAVTDLFHLLPADITLLVSPSNLWTRGYDLHLRHEVAECKASTKDLREAQAMIWFWRHRPQDWTTLPKYLETL